MAHPPSIPSRTQPFNAPPARPQAQDVAQLFMQGVTLHQQGQLPQAQAIYAQVLRHQPRHFDALYLLGVVAFQSNNPTLAAELMGEAIAINPGNAEAFYNRGVVLQELKRDEEALASYDRAIAIKPDYAEAYSNRGMALQELQRLDEALASYNSAIAIKPDYAQAHNNRGNTLSELKRLNEALDSYDKALSIQTDYAQAHLNRGNALKELNRLNEALDSYGRALAIKPDYAEAYCGSGNALKELNRLDEALGSYDRALALQPDMESLFSQNFHTRMLLCDWNGFSTRTANLKASVIAGNGVVSPFPVLGLLDDPELQLQTSRIHVEKKHPRKKDFGQFLQKLPSARLRVGYYSADLRSHPVAVLMAELFETLDRGKFEVVAFSFTPASADPMQQRLRRSFDQFIDASAMSDQEIVRLSRDMGIDIAVDLGGHTQGARTGIFAAGCAPIQVNYLGYPGTMGATYIDYIIADKTLIPAEAKAWYTEKIVCLPNSYMPRDTTQKIAERGSARSDVGLPEKDMVFCSFNNSYKILPETFDSWMKMLIAIEGSVLWLSDTHSTAKENLCKQAAAKGVDPERLIFAKRIDSMEEHLARYRLADLFVDTFPYNAHTTASDALWAGLPVLTCMGKSFAARVAASLLTVVDLPELITHTQEQYVATAIELARHPEKLAQIKSKLAQNRLISPLFNGSLFARHIEAAFMAMYQRYQSGLPPADIYIDA